MWCVIVCRSVFVMSWYFVVMWNLSRCAVMCRNVSWCVMVFTDRLLCVIVCLGVFCGDMVCCGML